jgi:hypothetical protein
MSTSRQHRRSRPASQGNAIIPSSRQQQRCSLQDLPSEIIDLIARELRAGYVPFRYGPYKCTQEHSDDQSFSVSTARADTYSDPAWALSCTSKRLRGIVFDRKMNRKTRIGYCHRCWCKAISIPQQARENVRYVSRALDSTSYVDNFTECA